MQSWAIYEPFNSCGFDSMLPIQTLPDSGGTAWLQNALAALCFHPPRYSSRQLSLCSIFCDSSIITTFCFTYIKITNLYLWYCPNSLILPLELVRLFRRSQEFLIVFVIVPSWNLNFWSSESHQVHLFGRTDERSKRRGNARIDYALQEGGRRSQSWQKSTKLILKPETKRFSLVSSSCVIAWTNCKP